MPAVMAAVHAAVAAAAQISPHRQPTTSPADAIGGAEAELMKRYEITAGEAHAVLAEPAFANRFPVERAARRLVEAREVTPRRQRTRRAGTRHHGSRRAAEHREIPASGAGWTSV